MLHYFSSHTYIEMMKDLGVDESMSNLTSASSEILSASSGTRNDTGSLYPQHSSTSTIQEPQPKKKRKLPGHTDPEAEVIALSPSTLLATNRFICDVCNKGFQRDQNLQLHRRGHNLPWKLKQRSSKEIRKKVYVCPEPTCVHHDPSMALGDLTGIKKHFCRKHGEKKWKCEKCSKRYAVQADCRAHSKVCGTREYRCECGTIFSRRDSFIAHRAFCDALAQESARAINTSANPLLFSQIQLHSQGLPSPSIKKEPEISLRPAIPSWLAYPHVGEASHGSSLRAIHFSSPPLLSTQLDQSLVHHGNPNPTTLLPSFQSVASHHMSATALLQKASQVGATMSKNASSLAVLRPYQQAHVPESSTGYNSFSMASSSAVSGLEMPSREEVGTGPFAHGLASYGNKDGIASEYLEEGVLTNTGAEGPSLFHDLMDGTVTAGSPFERSSFEEALRGMMNPTRDNNFQELVSKSPESQFSKNNNGFAGDTNDETRDLLGLRVFPQRALFNIRGDKEYTIHGYPFLTYSNGTSLNPTCNRGEL